MPRKRSRIAMALFGAVWLTIGAASVAYVVHHAHDHVATTP